MNNLFIPALDAIKILTIPELARKSRQHTPLPPSSKVHLSIVVENLHAAEHCDKDLHFVPVPVQPKI